MLARSKVCSDICRSLLEKDVSKQAIFRRETRNYIPFVVARLTFFRYVVQSKSAQMTCKPAMLLLVIYILEMTINSWARKWRLKLSLRHPN